MLTIDSFDIKSQLHESNHSLVYRATRQTDNQPVILKVLKEPYPSLEDVAWFKREYQLLHGLELAGVIKAYDQFLAKQHWVMVLEDFAGEALSRLNLIGQLDNQRFLPLAINITTILGQIQQYRIIHKDINPSNLVAKTTDDSQWFVKFIDFGISTVLPRESRVFCPPQGLEGTLAYISPEQTGRMNRLIDYRTDFYSLGVTFYELLTGRLPFEHDDPLELIHSHIAQQPTPPTEINPAIPPPLAELILKLMAKNAEDRYQSVHGIVHDLKQIQTMLTNPEKPSTFTLGQHDFSGQFQIPQKLYGRTTEVGAVLATFERVSAGTSELMLITGYSGVGKSALVHELYKPITAKHGYFITGKFDQYQRNTPYSAFIQAFNQFCRYVLTESDTELKQWQQTILQALGKNGQVLIDLIPNLALIIGPQPPVPPLGTQEQQNRFNLYFQLFIQAISQAEHPLTILVDDLQWADSASLNLLKLILGNPESQHVLLIGAYRHNEVSETHPLIVTLNDIAETETPISYIELQNLSPQHTLDLISETLQSDPEKVRPLAQMVYQKTYGNAFFVNQFLHSLYDDGLLTFNFSANEQQGVKGWQWDLAQIEAKALTDNVVTLMAEKIKKLPPESQNLLKLAAVIGNRFDLQNLATLRNQPLVVTVNQLIAAMQEGLILSLDDNYKLLAMLDETDSSASHSMFKFVHDRVQQAAYLLLTETERQTWHQQVGQLLLSQGQAIIDEHLFDLVNHLNYGVSLITDPAEQIQLAELNLQAAQKARLATAYQAAWDYCQAGLHLLPKNHWHSHYQLTLNLHTLGVETAFLCGEFATMTQLAQRVHQQSHDILDRARVYKAQLESYFSQNRLQDIIMLAREALQLFDITFPAKPNMGHVVFQIMKTKFTLRNYGFEQLLNLPLMTERRPLAIMEILILLANTAYFIDADLLPLVVLTQVNLSLKHGNAPASAIGYGNYAVILGGALGEIERANEFGRLALKLVEKFNNKQVEGYVTYVAQNLVFHWKNHLSETLAPTMHAHQTALEVGDFGAATTALFFHCGNSYFLGHHLNDVDTILKQSITVAKSLQQHTVLYWLEIYQQAVLNLIESPPNPSQLQSDDYNELERLPIYLQENDAGSLVAYGINKMILSYVFEAYEQALEKAIFTEPYLERIIGVPQVIQFHFYDSLIRLALYPDQDERGQRKIRARVKGNQKKLFKWAQFAPMNNQHKYNLVEAEFCRVLGKTGQAWTHYNEAINLAEEHNYLHEKALAYQLAGQFFLSQDQTETAQIYLRHAHYGYEYWGAITKVKQLEEKFPQFLGEAVRTSSLNNISVKGTATRKTQISFRLDINTVLRASQAISSEIELTSLLEKMMKFIIENAGAQQGFLLLPHSSGWIIQAHGRIEQGEIKVQHQAVSDALLPLSLINYVTRSHKDIVLMDASHHGDFTQDSYIIKRQPQSVLCMPLLKQGELTGLLYLENNLTTGAFTPGRLEVLKLLSSQMAISIENAKLYQEATKLSALQRELAIAHEMQESLLPPPQPDWPGLELVCYSTPAKEVGGDFYKYHLTSDKYIFAIGDISGKGVSASLLMATSLSQFDASLALDLGPIERMVHLDTVISPYTKPKRQNCAMCYVEITPETKVLQVVNAGCIPPYIKRRDGRMESMEIGGFALGQGLAALMGYQSITLSLSAGDIVILTSDGVVEANNKAGEMLGFDALENLLEQGPTDSAEAMLTYLKEALAEFTQEAAPHDDMTLMIIRV